MEAIFHPVTPRNRTKPEIRRGTQLGWNQDPNKKIVCLVSGKQREPQKSKKAKRGANSGEDKSRMPSRKLISLSCWLPLDPYNATVRGSLERDMARKLCTKKKPATPGNTKTCSFLHPPFQGLGARRLTMKGYKLQAMVTPEEFLAGSIGRE